MYEKENNMTQRIDYAKLCPEAYQLMLNLEKYIISCGLDSRLLHLIKIRASQINGCAYCIDKHTKDARQQGETEQRIYGLSAWKEAPYYNERERAALLWTENLTRIADAQEVSDELYNHAKQHFTEAELVNLTFAVMTINSWNRLAITFRKTVGSYNP
jgi:AhpD family alkylhydroperoxidase